MFVIPFMTRLGIINLWDNWSITGEIVKNSKIWSYKSVVGQILCFLACASQVLGVLKSKKYFIIVTPKINFRGKIVNY